MPSRKRGQVRSIQNDGRPDETRHQILHPSRFIIHHLEILLHIIISNRSSSATSSPAWCCLSRSWDLQTGLFWHHPHRQIGAGGRWDQSCRSAVLRRCTIMARSRRKCISAISQRPDARLETSMSYLTRLDPWYDETNWMPALKFGNLELELELQQLELKFELICRRDCRVGKEENLHDN